MVVVKRNLRWPGIEPGSTAWKAAVRCDGIYECWQGADEEGCNINGFQYTTG